MRTAIRTDPSSHGPRSAIALATVALALSATACADPPKELAELQRDHERCLVSEENAEGEVRYADYQACMTTRGWSDPDLAQRS
jgi:hypothetical protein